jgi:serine/threonine protein kinase
MKNRIYLIDFGLSKRFIDSQNKEHIDYKTNVNFTGSFRFSSIRNHKGIEQSRRDDLESIGYMLIFFLKGRLPWQGLTASTKGKRSKQIYQVKKDTSLEVLCEGIPKEFLLYMKYCMNLKFTQLPNYEILRNLFISLFKMSNYEMDYIYDWNLVAKFKKQYMYKEE